MGWLQSPYAKYIISSLHTGHVVSVDSDTLLAIFCTDCNIINKYEEDYNLVMFS